MNKLIEAIVRAIKVKRTASAAIDKYKFKTPERDRAWAAWNMACDAETAARKALEDYIEQACK